MTASEANTVAVQSGHDVVGDSQQPQHQTITIDDCPHISINDLLKIIKGANGMPVLFVPSMDGKLTTIAVVDGLRNPVPAIGAAEKKLEDFRAWLLLLTSLAATITFTAGFAPPGGFWASDEKAKGYVAGTSVMHSKFPIRYWLFHLSNSNAFFSSLMIIGMLAKNIYHKEPITVKNRALVLLVGLCFVSLGTSYISGTCVSFMGSIYSVVTFVGIISYMVVTRN